MVRYQHLGIAICVAGLALASAATEARADTRDACSTGTEFRGDVVSVKGTVSATDLRGQDWPLVARSILCSGDEIVTGARSSINFRLEGRNTTTGAANDSVTVIPVAADDCLGLRRGLISFISSVIGSHCVSTPLLNAGIDGTRALVAVDGATGDSFVLVQEDVVRVTATDDSGAEIRLSSAEGPEGNAAFATRTQPLVLATPDNVPEKFRSLYLSPDDAADWAIYYPPILLGAGATDPLVLRAAGLIDAGAFAEAEALLMQAPNDSNALALRAMLGVVKNRRDDALRLSADAIAADPASAPARIARSYALQADGRVAEARVAATAATEAAPDDAYAWARLGELALTDGDRPAAEAATATSLGLAETALGYTIQGFTALSATDLDMAETAFAQAIALDDEAPLPRLGQGLLAIRRGETSAGRLEIEAAVALAPQQADLRTWLGRAYFEEGRNDKAGTQLGVAQTLDPQDPNAFYFDALRLYRENRPIEALDALATAQETGAARAVVRSEKGLGEDLASRGTSLGRLFDSLGLDDRAITEGARATVSDPTNAGAHRFMAEIYGTRQNSEIAQTSSQLKADLLSGPTRAPIDTQLSESDLAILQGSGPSRSTFNEFSPLFDSNGIGIEVGGVGGTQGTFGEELAISVLHDGLSIGLGQFYYTTDGYRDNNDLEHQIVDVQVKGAPYDGLTLFGEVRSRRTVAGDRTQSFDPTDFDPISETTFERDFVRAGFHAEVTPDTDVLGVFTVGSLDTEEISTSAVAGSPNVATTDDSSNHLQLQGIHDFGGVTLTVGASYAQTDSTSAVTINDLIPVPVPFPPFVFFVPTTASTSISQDIEQFNGYAYATFEPLDAVSMLLGASYDVYDDPDGIGRESSFNPKAGIQIDVTDRIQVRAAYSQAVKPALISEQLLEPAAIMGIPQLIDITNGGNVETIGGAIDADLTRTLRAGAYATYHSFDTPVVGTTSRPETEDMTFGGYIQKTFMKRFALTVGGYHETAQSDTLFDLDDFKLTTASVSASYFDPLGFFGTVAVEPSFHSFKDDGVSGEDEFVMVNASIGYRLPNGRGLISLDAQNLLDQKVRFQEREIRSDIPIAPRFAPDMTLYLRGTFTF